MGLESPVGAGVEAGGGERALDAKLVLAGLHVVSHGLQGVEVVDFVHGRGFGTIQREVFVKDVLVVDQAVGFHHVRHTDHLVAVFQGHVLVGEFLIHIRVGHVGGVLLPVLVADRAVHLEQGRGLGLGNLGLQGLLVGTGGRGLHLDLNALFLGVFLGQSGPLISRFRLEIQVVDLALGVIAGGRASAGRQSAEGHRSDSRHRDC